VQFMNTRAIVRSVPRGNENFKLFFEPVRSSGRSDDPTRYFKRLYDSSTLHVRLTLHNVDILGVEPTSMRFLDVSSPKNSTPLQLHSCSETMIGVEVDTTRRHLGAQELCMARNRTDEPW